MIITTTPNIEGKQIEYKQVVFGEVIAGQTSCVIFLLALPM